MTEETLLFIGGPIDGRRQCVPVDLKVILVSDFSAKVYFPDATANHIYKKYVIRFEDADVTIAVIDYMTPLQAFLQMCDKYPPQFGADLNAG